MPHAFRSAAVIEAENAQRKLERLRDRWLASKDSWFDGSAESVERRLANTDEVISLCRSIGSRLHAAKVGSDALALLPQLQGQRRELEAMRTRITGGAWEDEHGVGFPHGEGWNTEAIEHYFEDPHERADWGGPDGHYRSFPIPGGSDGFRDVPPDVGTVYQCPQGHIHDAARDFVESQNTTDRQELLIRAQRLIEQRTSAWTPESAHAAKRDFLAAVRAAVPVQTREAAVVVAPMQDFDDHLMFS